MERGAHLQDAAGIWLAAVGLLEGMQPGRSWVHLFLKGPKGRIDIRISHAGSQAQHKGDARNPVL